MNGWSEAENQFSSTTLATQGLFCLPTRQSQALDRFEVWPRGQRMRGNFDRTSGARPYSSPSYPISCRSHISQPFPVT